MIVAVPKKSLTSAQKGKLTKAGYVIIECDNPESIRIITPEINVQPDEYFMAALFALYSNHTPLDKQERFVNELYERLSKLKKY